MSCVISTPDVVACDHLYIDVAAGSSTYVDVNKSKIYVNPNNKSLFALSGSFNPYQEEMDFIHSLIDKMLKYDDLKYYKVIRTIGRYIIEDTESLYDHYRCIFHDNLSGDNYLLVATRDKRFAVFFSLDKDLILLPIESFSALGAVKDYALGLLEAGVDVNDIWEPLRVLSPGSSSEYTLFHLNTLTAS